MEARGRAGAGSRKRKVVSQRYKRLRFGGLGLLVL